MLLNPYKSRNINCLNVKKVIIHNNKSINNRKSLLLKIFLYDVLILGNSGEFEKGK